MRRFFQFYAKTVGEIIKAVVMPSPGVRARRQRYRWGGGPNPGCGIKNLGAVRVAGYFRKTDGWGKFGSNEGALPESQVYRDVRWNVPLLPNTQRDRTRSPNKSRRIFFLP